MDSVATSLDRLLGGKVNLLQPQKGYRVAIDPVLLAAATPIAAGERALDMGCGTFAIGLCLAARVPGSFVVGLESNPAIAALARASIDLNNMNEFLSVIEGDAARPPVALRRDSFDHVITNPPYLTEDAAGRAAHAGPKAHAHVEGMTLAPWLDACLRRLRPAGYLSIVHRADRLDEILSHLSGRAGDIRIFPLWPRASSPKPSRLLVRARKGSRAGVQLLRGMVLHGEGGTFTAEASAVLRDGMPLKL
ncbi:tRNA1(Val) A37 N6-methylase TrmN6 [Arboricoccus pini]|uniref:tRNA1(Val) A37 N6-methylase TrmN6 n=1 Tax=Arboricoccus pini TaxID=1963835 RepID=A0A212QN55_9PROT|nr:methyltransferase [Arboricoccus pini]SNB60756.1 tRNA1(Val) A37 N6-methylase TrmN6 [Arboricoccus pini]